MKPRNATVEYQVFRIQVLANGIVNGKLCVCMYVLYYYSGDNEIHSGIIGPGT